MKTTTKVILGVGLGLGVAAGGFFLYKKSKQSAPVGAAAAVIPGQVVMPYHPQPSPVAPQAPSAMPSWAAHVNAGLNIANMAVNTGMGIARQLGL
jgi:hypothetical protein